MARITFSTSSVIQGRSPDEHVSLSVTETPIGSVVSGSTGTTDDINWQVYSGTVSNDCIVLPDQPIDWPNVNYTNNTPGIISIDSTTGQVTRLSNGQAELIIQSPVANSMRWRRVMDNSTAWSEERQTSYVSGTLGAHVQANIAALMSGKSSGNTYQQFYSVNNGDYLSPNVEYNPNLFASSLDWSGVSCIRSGRTNDSFPVVMVTDRHALAAKHVAAPVGETVVFKRNDGGYESAVVLDKTHVPQLAGDWFAPDLSVLYLDRIVPTGAGAVKRYKVMPSGWEAAYLPGAGTSISNGGINNLPTLRKSMHDLDDAWRSFLSINRLSFIKSSAINLQNGQPFQDTYSSFDAWRANIIGGDSGGPSFLVIDDGGGVELVLIGVQYTTDGSANITRYLSEIHTIMDTQAGVSPGTYTLQEVNLSGFTSYP